MPICVKNTGALLGEMLQTSECRTVVPRKNEMIRDCLCSAKEVLFLGCIHALYAEDVFDRTLPFIFVRQKTVRWIWIIGDYRIAVKSKNTILGMGKEHRIPETFQPLLTNHKSPITSHEYWESSIEHVSCTNCIACQARIRQKVKSPIGLIQHFSIFAKKCKFLSIFENFCKFLLKNAKKCQFLTHPKIRLISYVERTCINFHQKCQKSQKLTVHFTPRF